MSIPTPQLGHLTYDDYEHVYEPAEDSFILLDALEQDAEAIRSLRPSLSLEIGSGSGVVSAFLATLLGPVPSLLLATDLNPHACAATVRTAAANSITIDPVRCDLTSALTTRAASQVDLLVFNPPYVPTCEHELQQTQSINDIGGAWAGGALGMQVTNRLLELVPRLLSPNGRFYLVAIEQNKPDDIIAALSATLEGRIVLRRRAGREHLSVLCFTLPHV